MKNKFIFLTKLSLKKKICSKWFVIVNLLFAFLIIGLLNLQAIITFFGGNFNHDITVLMFDETNQAYDVFSSSLDSIVHESSTDLEGKITVKQVANEFNESTLKDNEVFIHLLLDTNNELFAKVISQKKIETLTYQLILQSLDNTKLAYTLDKNQIAPAVLNELSNPISIRRVVYHDQNSADENTNMIINTIFPTVILPIFMLTMILVQMVGGEICEEKSTKSMEIIISNVSPKVHLSSKILAGNLFVLLQAILLLLYVGLGFGAAKLFSNGIQLPSEVVSVLDSLKTTGFMDKLVYLIPLTLVLIVLSFIAYALVAGILASVTTNTEDFQQIQTPLMLISVVGYYLSIMAGVFEGSLFVRVLSYVPFLSSFLSPSLLLMGQISIVDVVVSIFILVLFIGILLTFGMKIYRVGVLNYSNEKVWNRFFKAFKEKDV